MSPRPSALHRALLAASAVLLVALLPMVALAQFTPSLGVRSATIMGDYVVYTANSDANRQRFDLFSVPLTGGTPARLTANLPDGEPSDFQAAGGRLVFSWSSSGKVGLYSVLLAGGEVLRLNPEYTADGAGDDLQFSVEGQRVIFVTQQERRAAGALYAVSPTGGPVMRLSIQLPDPSPFEVWSVRRAIVSDDGNTVAYTFALTSITGSGSELRLYSVPATGGESRLISSQSPIPGPGTVQFTPGGKHLLYLLPDTREGRSVQRLLSSPTAGGTPTELDVAGQLSFQLTSDGSRAVYVATPGLFDQQGLLKSVAVDGGTAVELGAQVPRDGFTLTPSADVLFAPEFRGLRRVSAAGGTAQTLLAPAAGSVSPTSIQFGADGRAVFVAQDSTNTGRVYIYAPGDAAAQPISPAGSFLNLVLNGISGNRVVYLGSGQDNRPPLFSVSLSGGQPTQLSGSLADGEQFLRGFVVARGLVLYGISRETPGGSIFPSFSRLLLVPVDGSAPPWAVGATPPIALPDPLPFRSYLPLTRR